MTGGIWKRRNSASIKPVINGVFMKIKRTAIAVLASLLAMLIMLLGACGKTPVEKIKVTFDFNDGFTPEKVVEIDSGTAVSKPEDPKRDGFVFAYWHVAGSDSAYDFTAPVTGALKLRAKWDVHEHTVTFFEYEGKTRKEVVTDGETLTRPGDPTRENFEFDGWYSDEARLQKFNFSSPITGDLTLYAKWREKGAVYFIVTFDLNYPGAPTATQTSVKQNEKVPTPTDPARGGYTFSGWYSDDAGLSLYNFDTPVTASISIYAGWNEVAGPKNYKLEAELTDISGLKGTGYSNEAEGSKMIQRDVSGNALASNGFWMGFLYMKGLALTFEFESASKVTDATLKLRLSAEFVNELVLTSAQFPVKLNGKTISYSDIRISDIDASINAEKRAFQDFVIGGNLTLEKGKNTVVLTVDNNTPLTGTDGKSAGGKIQATAPLVDCIKITTTATLSWTPYTEALEDRFGWDPDTMYGGIVEE